MKKILKSKYFWLSAVYIGCMTDILIDQEPDMTDYIWIVTGSYIFIGIVMYAAFEIFGKKK